MEVNELFERYGDAVYRLAWSFTGSRQDAEDVTQTVFLKVLEQKPDLLPGKERAWLLQVTANECRSLRRRLSRRRAEPLEELAGLAAPEREESVLRQVLSLRPGEREAVCLFYYEGYSTAEIAKMLRISRSAVTTRLQRGRKHLKDILKEEGFYEKCL